MSFQAPLFLLGLLAIPLALLALCARAPAAGEVRHPLPRGGHAGRGRRAGPAAARRIIPPALLCLALAGLVTALARPEATVAVPVEKASVDARHRHVGLDERRPTSPPPASPPPRRPRRASSTACPKSLQVGLVAYADGPHTVLRPTQDRDAGQDARCDALQADGGTATGDALDERAERARHARQEEPAGRDRAALRRRVARPGRTRPRSPSEAKRRRRPDLHGRARHRRRRRRSAGGQIARTSRPTPRRSRRSPQLSGGRAFTAEDADALDEVYQTLGSRIGTKKEKKEISAGFAAVGLLLLGGAAFTSLRWRGRLPLGEAASPIRQNVAKTTQPAAPMRRILGSDVLKRWSGARSRKSATAIQNAARTTRAMA